MTNSEKAIFLHFLLKITFDIICFTQEARFFCDLRLQNLHTVLALFIRREHFYRRLHKKRWSTLPLIVKPPKSFPPREVRIMSIVSKILWPWNFKQKPPPPQGKETTTFRGFIHCLINDPKHTLFSNSYSKNDSMICTIFFLNCTYDCCKLNLSSYFLAILWVNKACVCIFILWQTIQVVISSYCL